MTMPPPSVNTDASLALNIVAAPAAAKPAAKLASKKKRRNNKYDRRRHKAQKSREGKQRRNERIANAEAEKEEQEEEETLSNENEAIEERDCVPENSIEDNKPKEEEPLSANEDEDMKDDEAEQPEEEETADSAYQKHKHSLPEDEEERAKYLAEFHARPLELDRRSGATRYQKIKSKDSQHLFTYSTPEGGDDDNGDTLNKSEWDRYKLHPRIVQTLDSHFDMKRPTVIQTKTLPAFAAGNQLHNMLIHSETGSGKTLSFLLPILQSMAGKTTNEDSSSNQHIDRAKAGTRCLILCPTRELAVQTLDVVQSLASKCFHWLVSGSLLGQEKRKSEKARIRKGLAFIVATPGRFLDHLTRTEALQLSLKGKLEWLVLDEADRLLDMGLGEQVTQIVQRIRANQPGSGREGITWRTVLVSATVTPQVEQLAQELLLGSDTEWKRVRATNKDSQGQEKDLLADSTPCQLAQFHMTVSAKLRLTALIAFLMHRVQKNEKTVVFMATCASVDFHHALFEAVQSICSPDGSDDNSAGIFGADCTVFKLHGNVQHGERQHVLKRFAKRNRSILLATDVAARGLNLPNVDWTVQYDPPSEVSDYVHRAGRVARAGKAGHSLIFLLPSEHLFLDVLKQRGVKELNALSLTTTLNEAAAACKSLTTDGVNRSGGSKSSASRSGEAFCSELQLRLEDTIQQNDQKAKADQKAAAKASKKRKKRTSEKPHVAVGELLELAQKAFLSHIRAYPTREKTVRQIFSAKALHLGHVARSFALREPPKRLAGGKKKIATNHVLEDDSSSAKHTTMAFDFNSLEFQDESPKKRSKSNLAIGAQGSTLRQRKETMLANANKLLNSAMDM